MSGRPAGKRILVTDAGRYMGPAIADLFGEEGADVIVGHVIPFAEGRVTTTG